MERLAAALEQHGFLTFLPQRDGLEATNLGGQLSETGLGERDAKLAAQYAVFALDVYEVLEECAGTVANLNGRVPDEGTLVEASLTWFAGKPLVFFKDDSRAPFPFGDNPLVLGLTRFATVSTPGAVAMRFEALLRDSEPFRLPTLHSDNHTLLGAGRGIANARHQGSAENLTQAILRTFRDLTEVGIGHDRLS